MICSFALIYLNQHINGNLRTESSQGTVLCKSTVNPMWWPYMMNTPFVGTSQLADID